MKHAQTLSALVLLTTGVILSFIGFFTEPVGEISDSVLWYFAQTLIYAGSVFGLKAYVDKTLHGRLFHVQGYCISKLICNFATLKI